MEIKEILNMCTEKHVLLKRDQKDYDVPTGGDIDVLARDGRQLAREILHLMSGSISGGASMAISEHDGHIHIDYSMNGELQIRIDIIDSLDIFKDLLLQNNKYAHLAFRLFEYASRPDKQKHLDYVKQNL